MKSHFYLSESPITHWGESTVALCGVKLAHAEAVVMVKLSARGLPEFNSLQDCQKCIGLAEHDPRLLPPETGAGGWAPRRLYLYGICEGQEAQVA